MSESNERGQLADFEALDDPELFSRRAEMRAELEHLPQGSASHIALTSLYDLSTLIVNDRAREAWSKETGSVKPVNDKPASVGVRVQVQR